MAMFALVVTPMIRDLRQHHADIQQCWYADYGEAGGRLSVVHAFWRDITSLGPQYGYNPNAAKTKLLAKPGLEEEARILFADTPVIYIYGVMVPVIWVAQSARRSTSLDVYAVTWHCGVRRYVRWHRLPGRNHMRLRVLLPEACVGSGTINCDLTKTQNLRVLMNWIVSLEET